MKSHRSIWKSSRLNHFHLLLITGRPHSAIPIYLYIPPNERPTFGGDTIENLPALRHKLDGRSKNLSDHPNDPSVEDVQRTSSYFV